MSVQLCMPNLDPNINVSIRHCYFRSADLLDGYFLPQDLYNLVFIVGIVGILLFIINKYKEFKKKGKNER